MAGIFSKMFSNIWTDLEFRKKKNTWWKILHFKWWKISPILWQTTQQSLNSHKIEIIKKPGDDKNGTVTTCCFTTELATIVINRFQRKPMRCETANLIVLCRHSYKCTGILFFEILYSCKCNFPSFHYISIHGGGGWQLCTYLYLIAYICFVITLVSPCLLCIVWIQSPCQLL